MQKSRQPKRLIDRTGPDSTQTMGHGASLPSEYKQRIHTAFQVQDTAAWKACDDVDDCRPELIKLRRLASKLIHGERRKSTIYVH